MQSNMKYFVHTCTACVHCTHRLQLAQTLLIGNILCSSSMPAFDIGSVLNPFLFCPQQNKTYLILLPKSISI